MLVHSHNSPSDPFLHGYEKEAMECQTTSSCCGFNLKYFFRKPQTNQTSELLIFFPLPLPTPISSVLSVYSTCHSASFPVPHLPLQISLYYKACQNGTFEICELQPMAILHGLVPQMGMYNDSFLSSGNFTSWDVLHVCPSLQKLVNCVMEGWNSLNTPWNYILEGQDLKSSDGQGQYLWIVMEQVDDTQDHAKEYGFQERPATEVSFQHWSHQSYS